MTYNFTGMQNLQLCFWGILFGKQKWTYSRPLIPERFIVSKSF